MSINVIAINVVAIKYTNCLLVLSSKLLPYKIYQIAFWHCHKSCCHKIYQISSWYCHPNCCHIKYIKLPSGGLQATSLLQCLHSGGVPEHSPPKAEGKQEPFLWRVKLFVIHFSNFHLIKLVDQISDNINITPLCCHSLPPPCTSPGLNGFELFWVWLG